MKEKLPLHVFKYENKKIHIKYIHNNLCQTCPDKFWFIMLINCYVLKRGKKLYLTCYMIKTVKLCVKTDQTNCHVTAFIFVLLYILLLNI